MLMHGLFVRLGHYCVVGDGTICRLVGELELFYLLHT